MFGNGYKIFGEKNGMFNKKHTKEAKEQICQKNIGRKHSLETKEKHKINKTGEKNHMFGKNLYDIWFKKHGKETADYKYNQWKLKISKSGKNRIHTQETKEALSKAKTGTKCINNGEINKYIKKVILNEYISNGWKLGMLKK